MLREYLLYLPRWKKRLLCLLADTAMLWLALFLAYDIRLGYQEFSGRYTDQFLALSFIIPVVTLPVFIRMGLYRAVLRYMEHHVLFTVIRASVISAVCLSFVSMFFELGTVPRSVIVLFCLLTILLIGSSRYIARFWLSGVNISEIMLYSLNGKKSTVHSAQGVPVAIFGAGVAGAQLVESLDRGRRYKPVAFIDDDKSLHGSTVLGRQVFHSEQLVKMATAVAPEEVLLAIPSASRKRRKEVMKTLEVLGLPVRTMPDLNEIASGKLNIQEIQDVDIGDLLGREPVDPDQNLLDRSIKGKVVMVTGAGGSIGSELCRQIIKQKPELLVLLEHSEFNLYSIEQELIKARESLQLELDFIPILGSVNDPERLLDVMKSYRVQTVYHAAAYKHVPIVEQNISQGIRNNILGTLYSAQAAILSGVERFVLISSDKAVRPTNVMGASKRMAELALQGFSDSSEVKLIHPELFGNITQTVPNNTCFTMVRFGNVLGSSGSVIPKFREQIRAGGPVTVTHSEMTRYFMTIPEASQLVIQAGSMGTGGDVFVLDMGKPVKILNLAERMISLSGYSVQDASNPEGDIPIVFSGLRPGEKLYEELLIGDNVEGTGHPMIFRAMEESISWPVYKTAVTALLASVHSHNYEQTRELLMEYVSGFKPSSELVDLLGQLAPQEVEQRSTLKVVSSNDFIGSA